MVAAGFFTAPALYAEAYPRAPGDESGGVGSRAEACAGVLYGGNGSQLGANLVFLLLQGVWVLATVGALFYVLKWWGVLRVPSLVERTTRAAVRTHAPSGAAPPPPATSPL